MNTLNDAMMSANGPGDETVVHGMDEATAETVEDAENEGAQVAADTAPQLKYASIGYIAQGPTHQVVEVIDVGITRVQTVESGTGIVLKADYDYDSTARYEWYSWVSEDPLADYVSSEDYVRGTQVYCDGSVSGPGYERRTRYPDGSYRERSGDSYVHYNAAGRRTRVIHPDGGETVYIYDPVTGSEASSSYRSPNGDRWDSVTSGGITTIEGYDASIGRRYRHVTDDTGRTIHESWSFDGRFSPEGYEGSALDAVHTALAEAAKDLGVNETDLEVERLTSTESSGTLRYGIRVVSGTGAKRYYTVDAATGAILRLIPPPNAAQGGVDAVILDWDTDPDTKYDIYRREFGSESWSLIVQAEEAGRFIDQSAVSGISYQYEARPMISAVASVLPASIRPRMSVNYQVPQGLRPENVLVLIDVSEPGYVDIGSVIPGSETANGKLDPITESELLEYLELPADALSDGTDPTWHLIKDDQGRIFVPLGIYYAFRRNIPRENMVLLASAYGDVVSEIKGHMIRHGIAGRITSLVSAYHFPLTSGGYAWESVLNFGLWEAFGGRSEDLTGQENLGRHFSRILGDPGYLATRIDAADAEEARRTIDDSIWAEENYHFDDPAWLASNQLNAFVDWKGPHSGFDAHFLGAADELGASGLFGSRGDHWESTPDLATPGFIDRFDADADGRLDDTFLFTGWYHYWDYQDVFNWARGAIGWDMDSASAASYRDETMSWDDSLRPWASNVISHGAAATLGAVAEPFAHGHTQADLFMHYILSGYSFAEAGYFASRQHRDGPWMFSFGGDPLYTPFRGVSGGVGASERIHGGGSRIFGTNPYDVTNPSRQGPMRRPLDGRGEDYREFTDAGQLAFERQVVVGQGGLREISYLADGRTVILTGRIDLASNGDMLDDNRVVIYDASGRSIFETTVPSRGDGFAMDRFTLGVSGGIQLVRSFHDGRPDQVFDVGRKTFDFPDGFDAYQTRADGTAIIRVSSDGGFRSLGEALSFAQAGDEVVLSEGTYHEGGLSIPIGIKIRGDGDPSKVVIDGAGSKSGWTLVSNLPLEASGTSFEVSGMTFENFDIHNDNSWDYSFGGIIVVPFPDVQTVVQNIIFKDNDFNDMAGVIAVYSNTNTAPPTGSLSVLGCVFENNRFLDTNWGFSAPIVALLGDLTVSGSEFRNNGNLIGGSGGIATWGLGSLSVTDSVFENNGGIDGLGGFGAVNIGNVKQGIFENCRFLGNASQDPYFGTGGIFVQSGSEITVRNNVFAANDSPRAGSVLAGPSVKLTLENNDFIAGTDAACHATIIAAGSEAVISGFGNVFDGPSIRWTLAENAATIDLVRTTLIEPSLAVVYTAEERASAIEQLRFYGFRFSTASDDDIARLIRIKKRRLSMTA